MVRLRCPRCRVEQRLAAGVAPTCYHCGFPGPQTTQPAVQESAIVVDGLQKSYGDVVAVRDLSLRIRRGEVFGFVGPNGAGKTTTIRCILGLLRPDAGRVQVFGIDAATDRVEMLRHVGYVPGELALYENLTGAQFLRYIARLRGTPVGDGVHRVAQLFSINLDKRIRELSKGNKQKLGLAQALMHDPDVLIMDEPTSGLDPLLQRRFHDELQRVRTDGRTVFLSSHVMSEVEDTCDRVGVIRAGELVAVESVRALKSRAPRRVEIRFAKHVPLSRLAEIPGVQDVSAQGLRVRMRFRGPPQPLLDALSSMRVDDFVIHPPELEEIIQGYYPEATA